MLSFYVYFVSFCFLNKTIINRDIIIIIIAYYEKNVGFYS